jgi:hypothetical protein
MEQPRFANGRSVRNAIERARLRHASRVVNEKDKVGKDDLMRIEAEGILKSGVFADQDEGMHDRSGDGSKSDGEKSEDGSKGARPRARTARARTARARTARASPTGRRRKRPRPEGLSSPQ